MEASRTHYSISEETDRRTELPTLRTHLGRCLLVRSRGSKAIVNFFQLRRKGLRQRLPHVPAIVVCGIDAAGRVRPCAKGRDPLGRRRRAAHYPLGTDMFHTLDLVGGDRVDSWLASWFTRVLMVNLLDSSSDTPIHSRSKHRKPMLFQGSTQEKYNDRSSLPFAQALVEIPSKIDHVPCAKCNRFTRATRHMGSSNAFQTAMPIRWATSNL